MTRDDHYAPAPIPLPELLARYDPEQLAADLAEDPTAVLDAAEWDAWVLSLCPPGTRSSGRPRRRGRTCRFKE